MHVDQQCGCLDKPLHFVPLRNLTVFPGGLSNSQSPHLSVLSSWDFRYTPWCAIWTGLPQMNSQRKPAKDENERTQLGI